MSKRASLSVSAVVVMLSLCVPARAADTSPAAPPAAAPSPEHRAPKKAAPPPAAPRAADDPYRCHPSEDVACTVVRETAQGTLIVTMRPRGQSALTPAWTVVSGAPPSAGPHPGGTVYVVPNAAPSVETTSHQAALMPPNGAPILD